MGRRKEPAKGRTLAEQADRHELYEKAVQCVEAEIDMVDETYLELRGRRAATLREDFCGTANTSCEWVRRRKRNRAVGLDLDPEVLAWGRRHNLAKLKPDQRSRVILQQEDVLHHGGEPVDLVLAMNFSYQLFKTRDRLREYFTAVRRGLKEDGIFFLDAFGGYESYKEIREKTRYADFTYIWEQAKYNPIDGRMLCYIHFTFPDGSKLKRAFTYHWRLWTLPELREILDEAGFAKSTVYWEGTDEETGEGNGIYTAAEVGEADPSWICYLSAEK